MLTAGLGGVTRHGCVALSDGRGLLGVCEQERVTRVRSAGFNATGLPDEALDMLLGRIGRTRSDVSRYVVAEGQRAATPSSVIERMDHHHAHASSSYLASAFPSAAIVVCDQESPCVSVWKGEGGEVARVEWPWEGPGFADLYTACARVLGFRSERGAQRFEALARLRPEARDDRVAGLFRLEGSSLWTEPSWERTVGEWCEAARRAANPVPARAALAASLQGRILEVFLEFIRRVQARIGTDRLCLAGSFFYHSALNTAAKCHGSFTHVFVPVNPGNAGLAVGTALYGNGRAATELSPFLGPAYESHEIKQTLDNCKLQYAWESEATVIQRAVEALQAGTLVGWFEGAMEWGPRALGARSILANPFAPYVLENLNQFLKHREPWRGYALSGLEPSVGQYFEGPVQARFMECDYRPLDRERFRHVLPSPEAALRLQTVGANTPPRFRRLLEAFGAATGLPFLVNTSFNGFHEPIVCSPRDAVRVFYGSGLDVLMLEQFVLRK